MLWPQASSLDDGGHHALLHYHLDEEDVHGRHGDGAEVGWSKDASQEKGHDRRGYLFATIHDVGPLQGVAEGSPRGCLYLYLHA